MRKGFSLLLIVTIAGVIIGAMGLLAFQKFSTPRNYNGNPPYFTYFTYKVPQGWKENGTEPNQNKYEINIESPDYTTGPLNSMTEKEMRIWIQQSPAKNGAKLESCDLGPTAGVSEAKQTTIDNKPALMQHINYEGYQLRYCLLNSNSQWDIRFYSASLSEEQKYQQQISEFINSILFQSIPNTTQVDHNFF